MQTAANSNCDTMILRIAERSTSDLFPQAYMVERLVTGVSG